MLQNQKYQINYEFKAFNFTTDPDYKVSLGKTCSNDKSFIYLGVVDTKVQDLYEVNGVIKNWNLEGQYENNACIG